MPSHARLLEEALLEYAEHQSWRCDYPPHWYLVEPSVVPENDCPCGLLGTLATLGLVWDHGRAERKA
jgi:hypothetical protein